MSTIRVFAVDPHEVVRVGLRAILDTGPGTELVGEAADAPTAVRLADELDPDVVVAEVALPGSSGAELTARLCHDRPDRKVLILTACEDGEWLRQVLAAGAVGYALKRSAADELVRAIRTVADGGIYLGPVVTAQVVDECARPEPAGAELSVRECEVVRLIALGYSNKEIAARLRLSVKTVETYKTRSMEKLHIRSRVDIVRYAAQRGWMGNLDGPPPVPERVAHGVG